MVNPLSASSQELQNDLDMQDILDVPLVILILSLPRLASSESTRQAVASFLLRAVSDYNHIRVNVSANVAI